MTTPSGHSLTMRRVFATTPERVFHAFADPNLVKVWMGGPHVESPHADIDFRVGGRYRVQLQPPYGPAFHVEGVYQTIDPPKKLVYTWTFVGADIETGETLVTVYFRQVEAGTEVTLSHEQLPSEPVRDIHHEGWTGLLANLDVLLADK